MSESLGVSADADIKAVPVRHTGRALASVVVLIVLLSILWSVVNNGRFQWEVVGQFLFAPTVVHGAMWTLGLTAVGMIGGVILGVIAAVMRMSDNYLLRSVSGAYIWFFRGTPLLVQILFLYFFSALYPQIILGVPFGGPDFVSFDTNSLLPATVAVCLALILNEGAYMAEIVRGGFLSVDHGQNEAAQALGMRRGQIIRRIVLPQAMRVIIPPTGNEVINMLKNTALASVVAFPELLYAVQTIYSQNFKQIPLLIVACVWYLFFTTVLSIIQFFVERRFGRGNSSPAQDPLTFIVVRRLAGKTGG